MVLWTLTLGLKVGSAFFLNFSKVIFVKLTDTYLGLEEIIVNYGTDIPHLAGNHSRYLYGPGSILVAHSDDEHLTVRDLEGAVEGYMKLVKHVLGYERKDKELELENEKFEL